MDDLIREQLVIRTIIWGLNKTCNQAEQEIEYQKLFREITEAQIQVIEWNGQLDVEVDIKAEETVILTDDVKFIEVLWNQKRYTVIYVEQEGQEDLVHADYVIQGFDEVGIQLLDRILKRHCHLPWTILYTERTCVKEITLSDMDELFEMYEDESIVRYTEPLFERKEEEKYTRQYIETMYYYYGFGMWMVWDKKTGRLIGRVGIERREDETTKETWLELGYIIGKEWQRQGYATEVCKQVLAYAKENLCLSELYCVIHPDNAVSIHLAKKLGFFYVDMILVHGKEYCRYWKNLV